MPLPPSSGARAGEGGGGGSGGGGRYRLELVCGRVGPGPCVVRSRLLLPQVRPAQWYVALLGWMAATLKFRIAKYILRVRGRGGGRGGPGEGGGSWGLGGEISTPFAPSSVVRMRPSMGRSRARFPLGAENLESRNKF